MKTERQAVVPIKCYAIDGYQQEMVGRTHYEALIINKKESKQNHLQRKARNRITDIYVEKHIYVFAGYGEEINTEQKELVTCTELI